MVAGEWLSWYSDPNSSPSVREKGRKKKIEGVSDEA
jgi:hypothetical protein